MKSFKFIYLCQVELHNQPLFFLFMLNYFIFNKPYSFCYNLFKNEGGYRMAELKTSLQDIWEKTLAILEKELNQVSFQTWLKATKPISLTDSEVLIAVPNEFARNWLNTKYYDLVKETIDAVTQKDLEIEFIIPGEVIPEKEKEKEGAKENKSRLFASFNLNPRYTFDSFVVGNSNRFAHAASLAVAQNPGKTYNPLFLYGGVGLGKTHLMHAIGHFVKSLKQEKKVVYATSEQFTNELINAIRDDKTQEFRDKYRGVDVLLIDDIQFLIGKERTQEEFFHTFNTLYEANRQIVISSDRPPKDIHTLEQRLRSRFEWGLTTDIQPPDFETRVAILRKKADYDNLKLEDEILNYIASNIKSNIRELEGALNRVSAYAFLIHQELTLDLAREVLKDLMPEEAKKVLTVEDIQKAVAAYFKIEVKELKGKKRNQEIAYPRQIAMYLCRELTDTPLVKVGDSFGGRDHTTVMHACSRIGELITNDASVKKIIEDIKGSLII